MFEQCVKEECPQEMESKYGASNDEPQTDIMSGHYVNQVSPQVMECVWLTVKQEPQEEELPVKVMDDQFLPNMEEPDVHYSILPLKVEPKDEVSIDDHCESPGRRSDEVLSSSSVRDMSDLRTSISATVPLHSHPFSPNIVECYNSRDTLKEDHINEGNYKIIDEVSYSIPVYQEAVAGIVATKRLKQEPIGDKMSMESMKQEDPHVQDATDMNSRLLSLQVESNNKITIEDISPGKCLDGVSTWSSVNDMSNPGTCTTGSTSSQPSVFCAKLVDNDNQGLSLKKEHTVDDHAQHTVLNMYKKVKTNVRIHGRRKRNKVIHKCMECGKYFTLNSSLKKHLKIHTGEKDHKCTHCGKCFTQSATLKQHLNIHADEKDHKCIECGKCFAQIGRLKQHLKIHSGEQEHKCIECGKCFTYSFGLRAHLKIHSGKKDHECTECGKCFTHRGDFKEHLKIHSGRKDYKCAECGKCFTVSNSLRQHLKTHSGEKAYVCAECGKCFTQNSTLKKHLTVHSGEKDHKCTECGSCFTQRSSLKQHLKLHSGEKAYKCTACGKCFTQSSGLRQHLKIHSCQKEHKCTECGKCFMSSSGLRQHLKIHSHYKVVQNVGTALL